ncbi:phosphotransferase [Candidatus Vidania fulgoroideorum]
MSVFTKIKKKNIIKIIYKIYNINIIIVKKTKKGTENTNFFIEDDIKNKYVFTIFEKLNKKEIYFYTKILKKMYYKNILVPNIIRNINCKLFFLIKKINKYSILSKKIKGINLKKINCKKSEILGNNIANINNIFVFKKDYLREKIFKKIKYFKSKIIYKEFLYFKKNYKINCFCHNDLFKDNLFFYKKKNKLKGIIDIYFSSSSNYIIDISIIVNEWFLKRKINTDLLVSFLRGYNCIKKINRKYIKNIIFFLRTCAFRIMILRLINKYLYKKKKISNYYSYFKKIEYYKNNIFK